MSLSFSARILGLASAAGLSALTFSCRLDHHTTPARPAITMAATSRRVVFIAVLPPPPPHSHSRHYDQQRKSNHTRIEQHAHLASVHIERIIGWLLRPDGDQVLI